MPETSDEIAMTPRAIQTRAEMAHEWASSKAAEGILPWSVRQHFGDDVPKLIETMIGLKQDLDDQLELNTELAARLLAVSSLETSRIGASASAIGDADPVAFYAGVSFALAKVRAALRAE